MRPMACAAPIRASLLNERSSTSARSTSSRSNTHVKASVHVPQQRVSATALALASALVMAAAPSPSFARAPPSPSYSGVDPAQSSFIQGLVKKSAEDKDALNQQRLDNFYNRKFRINEIVGAEVLQEPCDPRDPEYGFKCRPSLPRLPQDRFVDKAFEEPKIGFGLVKSKAEVDAAAEALIERSDESLGNDETVISDEIESGASIVATDDVITDTNELDKALSD